MLYLCLRCKTEFKAKPANTDIKRKRKFCSWKCYKLYKKELPLPLPRIERICPYCNIQFRTNDKRQIFCSHNCSTFYRKKTGSGKKRIKLKCKHCGNIFEVRPCEKHRLFCSVECSYLFTKIKRGINICIKKGSVMRRYCNIRKRAEEKNLPVMSREMFNQWYDNALKKCFYCDMPEEIWENFYRGYHNKFSLSIDRMDNDKGYTNDNITFACGMCNVVKSNVLSVWEMKDIGQRYIKPKWLKRIQEESYVETIV